MLGECLYNCSELHEWKCSADILSLTPAICSWKAYHTTIAAVLIVQRQSVMRTLQNLHLLQVNRTSVPAEVGSDNWIFK